VFVAIHFAPAALALLKAQNDDTTPPKAVRQARALAVATVFLTAIVTYLLSIAETYLHVQLQPPILAHLFLPVLASVPLLLLYVSLSLIANRNTSEHVLKPTGSSQ
jgi:hypothetical protein